jgi:hypothetical protein
MKWFSLCHGEGLRLCESCKRHVDRWPQDAMDPHQPFLAPAVRGERCSHWQADSTPARTEPQA